MNICLHLTLGWIATKLVGVMQYIDIKKLQPKYKYDYVFKNTSQHVLKL